MSDEYIYFLSPEDEITEVVRDVFVARCLNVECREYGLEDSTYGRDDFDCRACGHALHWKDERGSR